MQIINFSPVYKEQNNILTKYEYKKRHQRIKKKINAQLN